MTVTAEYAQSHLHELMIATERGEEVEISREDGFAVKLVSEHLPARRDRSGLFGALKGKMWVAEDWDSPQTNEEIARLFNQSEFYPPES